MATSPISKILLSVNAYRKFYTNILQKYTFFKLEDTFFWGAIHADFENWTR